MMRRLIFPPYGRPSNAWLREVRDGALVIGAPLVVFAAVALAYHAWGAPR